MEKKAAPKSRAGGRAAATRVPAKPDPTPLMLASRLEPHQIAAILQPYGIRSAAEADANLQAMAVDPFARRQLTEILSPLLKSIGETADPDQALNHWERLLSAVNRSTLLEFVRQSPRMLDLLCAVFGNSDALAFTLIRDPALMYWLADAAVLEAQPDRKQLERALHDSLGHVTAVELKLDALRRFKRRELLRIGVRDLLKLADVPATTAALSDLASVSIDAAYRVADAELRSKYGIPMHKNRQGRWTETRFAVIGMGKLGGHELNYSSDVDVIYVYESLDGETRPPRQAKARKNGAAYGISNEEYFEMLSRDVTRALTEQTKEGTVFRVDLRLRAEGMVGRLARSLDDYRTYYRTRGQVWERLALLKAWPVAGSVDVGKSFIRVVTPFVLGTSGGTKDQSCVKKVIEDVRSVKEMIDAKMEERGHERRNVKLGVGGIREIEFLVQTVQVLAGRTRRSLLDRSTIGSLRRLASDKLISLDERDALTTAYVFLRDVEHKLQMVHDLQTHALPEKDEELEECAIRMGYGRGDRTAARRRFVADHERHTTHVNNLFRSFFYRTETSPLFASTCRAMRLRRS